MHCNVCNAYPIQHCISQSHVWRAARDSDQGSRQSEGCAVVCSGPLRVAQGQGEWLTTKIQQNNGGGAGLERGRGGGRQSEQSRRPPRPCDGRPSRHPGKSMHYPQPFVYDGNQGRDPGSDVMTCPMRGHLWLFVMHTHHPRQATPWSLSDRQLNFERFK